MRGLIALLAVTLAWLGMSTAEAGTVSGTVRADTGEPIAGVLVRLGGQDIMSSGGFNQGFAGTAVTDDAGRYRITGVPARPFILHALPPPAFSATIWPATYCMPQGSCAIAGLGSSLVFEPDSDFVRDFMVPRRTSVSGRVTDRDTGAPVPGAVVWARVPGSVNAGLRRSVAPTADGSYLLDGLPPGDWRVWVDAPGFPSQVWLDRNCPGSCADGSGGDPLPTVPAQARSGVDFRLRRGGEIRGVVREASGGPLAHPASVNLWRLDGSFAAFVAQRRVDAITPGFAFVALPDGTYKVSARSGGIDGIGKHVAQVFDGASCAAGDCLQGQVPGLGNELVITGDATREGIEIALEPAGSISGCVRAFPSGDPLPGIRVAVGRTSGTSLPGFPPPTYYQHGEALTDAQGCYRLTHLDETRNWPFGGIVSSAQGHYAATIPPISLAFDEDRTGVDVWLERGAWFQGVLWDRYRGTPVVGARVHVFELSGIAAGGPGSAAVQRSDAEGRFGTAGLAPGSYRVVFEVPEGTAAGVFVLGGATCSAATAPCIPPEDGDVLTLGVQEARDLGTIAVGDLLTRDGFEP